jgi:hypothetical protein
MTRVTRIVCSMSGVLLIPVCLLLAAALPQQTTWPEKDWPKDNPDSLREAGIPSHVCARLRHHLRHGSQDAAECAPDGSLQLFRSCVASLLSRFGDAFDAVGQQDGHIHHYWNGNDKRRLYPRKDSGKLVWMCLGFGGQRLMVFPEEQMIVVFTGWQILGDEAHISELVERVLPAVQGPAVENP